ncbi:MAG: hypothetical protein AVDCRST_MAG54-4491 [uncultured Actinomycetospora sp.]|uniref:Uncharacterized protein n=1 Tax=uncultured Actinomycetospora sp. TaxID=1135996 RepID=A0A6J4JZX0_9PSEU|nr:MAG: hypothetical protein AVDCRST_MAG54-4491 [uncultured Actinomycetospora sp.]
MSSGPGASAGSPSTPRSFATARCWATRTAPGVEPTASAVSSADRPTTTRSTRISRCLAGSCASRVRISALADISSACCSGPAMSANPSGTSSVGSERSRPAWRWASATLCAAMP